MKRLKKAYGITGGLDVEDREKLRLIWGLNPKLKSVVILYYVEGYSVKETSAILNITEVAVKKRLQRARDILSDLGRYYEGGIVCE